MIDQNTSLAATTQVSGEIPLSQPEPYITGAADGRVSVASRDIAMPKSGWFHGRVFVDPNSKNPDPGSKRYAGTYHLWIAPPAHPPQNQYVDITFVFNQ